MGKTQSNKTLTAGEILRLPTPIILCVDRQAYIDAITAAGYQLVSLNLPLAKSISKNTINEIPLVIFQKIRNILPNSRPVYLTDYEMLFDPRYSCCRLGKKHRFVDIR